MTEEMQTLTDRMERIESKHDHIEQRFLAVVETINDKINALTIQSASRRDCPSPALLCLPQTRQKLLPRLLHLPIRAVTAFRTALRSRPPTRCLQGC